MRPAAPGPTTSPAVRPAVTFAVPGSPCSTNLLWRHENGRVHLSDEARAWKAKVERAARDAGLPPLDGPIAVRLRYCYRTPACRIDLDNTLKGTLDGLKAFFDDAQVVRIEADARHDPRRPRVMVSIVPLGPEPLRLFDELAPRPRRTLR